MPKVLTRCVEIKHGVRKIDTNALEAAKSSVCEQKISQHRWRRRSSTQKSVGKRGKEIEQCEGAAARTRECALAFHKGKKSIRRPQLQIDWQTISADAGPKARVKNHAEALTRRSGRHKHGSKDLTQSSQIGLDKRKERKGGWVGGLWWSVSVIAGRGRGVCVNGSMFRAPRAPKVARIDSWDKTHGGVDEGSLCGRF